MTEEEYQDEIRRRDEIIDSLEGVRMDYLFMDAQIQALKSVIERSITGDEIRKLVRAIIYA